MGFSSALLVSALLQVTMASVQVSQTYAYDAFGRLTAVATANGSTGSGTISNYILDRAGNRTLANVEITPARISADRLAPGEALTATQSLISTDGRFRFVLQADGHAVIYGPNGFLWSTGTWGSQATMLAMQGDGNLALYNDVRAPVWLSGTQGHPGAYVVMQNDGNLVVYQGATFLWASGTGGH